MLGNTIHTYVGRVENDKVNIPALRNHKAPTPQPKAFTQNNKHSVSTMINPAFSYQTKTHGRFRLPPVCTFSHLL